ncbi:hypothetical protein [EBPR podovirus 3]|nr:hypothetical protein [EBPR podovirus 3]
MGSFMQVYTDGGGIREARVPDDYSGNGSQPFIIKFPGFRKSLLASLVTSSTASRTSDVVTIAATAHGVTTGSIYVGFRFFYPGSPSLAAGWYDSITDVQTNTISFNAPGANFGSQSVNGAAIYTTLTSIIATTIPANTLRSSSKITSNLFRSGDTTATTKNLRNIFGGQQLGLSVANSTPHGTHRLSIYFEDGSALSVASQDGVSSSFLPRVAMDLSVDQTFGISGSVSAAAGFVALHNASLEIVQ